MHAWETLFSKKVLQFQIVANCVRMHALEMLFYFFSQLFHLPKYRFKLRQTALLSVFVFKLVSAVSTSKISFQIAPDSPIKRICFQTCLGSFNFQNIVLNSVKRHLLVSLILTISQHLQLSKHRLNSVKRNRSASLFLKCSKQFFFIFLWK